MNGNDPHDKLTTDFAPPARAANHDLRRHIEMVNQSPLIDTILQTVGGLIAVLNEQRQLLAINDHMLDALHMDGTMLGLRLGEAINCTHASDHPGGCGAGPACATCGAAIAMVTSLKQNSPAEAQCVVTIKRDAQLYDYYFRVRCAPIGLAGQRFLLLFLLDATLEQKHAALERAFFHDLGNLIASLMLSTKALAYHVDSPALQRQVDRVRHMMTRLAKEVEIQRLLSMDRLHDYEMRLERVPLADLLQTLREFLLNYAEHNRKRLRFPDALPPLELYTDLVLLTRVLSNMLVNALEATPEDGEIRLWVEHFNGRVTFCIWNAEPIPKKVQPRVFQRNFSTKSGTGRGLGTYIMKLLGENYLGGTVSFTSSPRDGTIFRLQLPLGTSDSTRAGARAAAAAPADGTQVPTEPPDTPA